LRIDRNVVQASLIDTVAEVNAHDFPFFRLRHFEKARRAFFVRSDRQLVGKFAQLVRPMMEVKAGCAFPPDALLAFHHTVVKRFETDYVFLIHQIAPIMDCCRRVYSARPARCLHHDGIVSPFRAGYSAPCISTNRSPFAMRKSYVRFDIQSGGAPIRVVRVVRVQVARCVDNPGIVQIVAIARTPPAVLRVTAYNPSFAYSSRSDLIHAVTMSRIRLHCLFQCLIRFMLR